MDSGVYSIYNIKTGKFYIGSSITLKKRLVEHNNSLKRGDHYASYLQSSWNKRNKKDFIFRVLRYCKPEDCIPLEQYFLNALDPEYNTCEIAGSCLGVKRSDEVKKAISLRQTGRKASDEAKRKMSLAKKGKPLSEEHASKSRVANLSKTFSKEHKLKISLGNKGKTRSEETCKRISVSQCKPILQIHPINNNIISEFYSIIEASAVTKISNTSIGRVVANKQRLAGGYIWKLKNKN